jgi:threonyl-tRNA synthetase
VLPISEKTVDYAIEVLTLLKNAGVRATLDDSGERIQAKVKVATDMKVPYLLVVGPRDAEQRAVSVRAFGVRQDLGAMPLDAFVDTLRSEISTRGARTVLKEHFQTAGVA